MQHSVVPKLERLYFNLNFSYGLKFLMIFLKYFQGLAYSLKILLDMSLSIYSKLFKYHQITATILSLLDIIIIISI